MDGGAMKGWIGVLDEKEVADGVSPFLNDGWLSLSAKITLLTRENFENSLPTVPKQTLKKQFPTIDSNSGIQTEGVIC